MVAPVSDCGLTDGRIELVITAADRPLEYSYRSQNGIPIWENNYIFDNLKKHKARVRVRNIDGTCATDVYADLVSVEAPTAPTIQNVILNKHPSDCGASDGQIIVRAAVIIGDTLGALDYRVAGRVWQNRSYY